MNGCTAANAKIVFLFLGFSNCDVEICGGHVDAWDLDRRSRDPKLPQLQREACATQCPNLNNPDPVMFPQAWNRAFRGMAWDGYEQPSFLEQIYPLPPNPQLVGPSIVVFNGALGGQDLKRWDPTSLGYFYDEAHDCPYNLYTNYDPECNFTRVSLALAANGFNDKQVQAVFIKSADGFPMCSLGYNDACTGTETTYDYLVAEQHLGNIVRYLKCCKFNPQGGVPQPRYPNLKQVFVTSRIYGGYANGPHKGNAMTCLNPEPFAYELGFGVQRLITAQIRQTAGITVPSDTYAGTLDYTVAPWVNWGPYLWANGNIPRGDQLVWCNAQGDLQCGQEHDVLWDPTDDPLDREFGDYTHPTGDAVGKVAGKLVNFIQTSAWITPWIGR